MSRASLLAAGAAALGVAAAWEALAALEAAALTRSISRLLRPLQRAGSEGREPTAPERRRLAMVGAAGLLGTGWLVASPAVGVLLAFAGPWAVLALVRMRRRRWLGELHRDASLVARALADALAGGHSIRGAVSAAARDGGVPGPAGAELRAAASALALGEPTDAVLERLRARAEGGPYDTLVAAMLLQREAGGDLAGLLRGVAATLEEAARLERDARALTAQARFTGLLVTVLPLGTAGLAELASPGYLTGLLGSPLTVWLAGCALLFQAAALVLISRMARVPE